VDGESRAGAASERQREPTSAAAAIARPVAGVDAKGDRDVGYRDEARCVTPAVGGNRHALGERHQEGNGFLFCCGSDGNRRAAGSQSSMILCVL
jgi:hypothetical protein